MKVNTTNPRNLQPKHNYLIGMPKYYMLHNMCVYSICYIRHCGICITYTSKLLKYGYELSVLVSTLPLPIVKLLSRKKCAASRSTPSLAKISLTLFKYI